MSSRKRDRRAAFALAMLGMLSSTSLAVADPCGMVPPLRIATGPNQVAIKRIGVQKTYVSYKRGVMTMVLRPGFEGKVDEFGMLIPFPSPPALRKVDENTFPHIAAAADPPEVVAYVNRRRRLPRRAFFGKAATSAPAADESRLAVKRDQVRVVNREAVGMYDVAVLSAGSAKALKRWMDKNKFRYPTGMDEVTNDYVQQGWVFVAIKTLVGQKAGVNPRPGMKSVNSRLPNGAGFTGHVQAMGFRYKSKDFVIPMRLSAFNPGDTRNVVYILSDSAKHIRHIPKRFVKRQISGRELYRNVTKPLPLRVIGGRLKDLSKWERDNVKRRRDPAPHNGIAKELFASDMLAVRTGKLSNRFEEEEKELLRIGEALGMRGNNVDALHRSELAKRRARAVKRALRDLKGMTLTVIDGDFDRNLVAKENLMVAGYRMPRHRNNRKTYDSRQLGPAVGPTGGRLYRSSVDSLMKKHKRPLFFRLPTFGDRGPDRSLPWSLGFGVLAVFLLGGALVVRRRAPGRSGPLAVLVLAIGLGATGAAQAQTNNSLLQRLGKKNAQAAVDTLVKRGPGVVSDVLDDIADTEDLTRKGWGIVVLSRIRGDRATEGLKAIYSSNNHKMLVRSWAAAAQIGRAITVDELLNFAPLARQFPSANRPFTLKLEALLQNSRRIKTDKLLGLLSRVPQANAAIQSVIVKRGAADFLRAMTSSKDNNTRRLAASYLGSKDQRSVARMVIQRLRFKRGAKDVPWAGGALFLPGIQWQPVEARRLVGELLQWYAWADGQGRKDIKQQVHNNIRGTGLQRSAGYRSPGWNDPGLDGWMRVWEPVVGARKVRAIRALAGR